MKNTVVSGGAAILALFSAEIIFSEISFAAEYYVDSTISQTCSNYSPQNRVCDGGASTAYPDMNSGLSALSPGDTLYLRAGNYGQLNVTISGSPSSPIMIRGMAGEIVTITTTSAVGIWVINRSDIIISDLIVTNVQGFGRIEGSTRITLDNIQFSDAGASGTTGALKFVRSNNNRVSNSSFDNGSDLLLLQDDSDRNVISGNSFGRADHSLISIRCGSENIIRKNVFNNPDQKAMEVFDCEGVSDAPVRLDDARRNLIESNWFNGTAASWKPNDYNAIQHGGQENIVRFNVFQGNLGGGVNYQEYSDESLYVYGNRLFNNTFYDNRCYGVIGQSGPSSRFYDNRVVNNLLFKNADCSGGDGQVSIEDPTSVILTNNSEVLIDPGFVNASVGEFNLQPNSQEVDAGVFVAKTVGAGSGITLQVDDSGWFSDGFGITSESGDLIQLQGAGEPIRVLAIDYANDVLTLETATSWSDGQGVHLKYTGNAPDVGAFEYSADLVRPRAPENLQVN